MNHWKDAERQAGYVEALKRINSAPAPAPVRPHALLGWGIVLCSLAIVGIAVWFLSGVRFDW